MIKRMWITVVIGCIAAVLYPAQGSMTLKQDARWLHGDLGENAILTPIFFSDVDSDGDLILKIGRRGAALVTSKKVTFFAEIGQGPAEIPAYMAMNVLPENKLAFLSMPTQIKVFTKKNGMYHVTDSEGLFLENGHWPLLARAITRIDNKWLVTGFFLTSEQKNGDHYSYTALQAKIFDTSGKTAAGLMACGSSKTDRKDMIDHLIMTENKDVFLIIENELKLHRISMESNELRDTIVLKKPASYVPMPADFYTHKKYKNDPSAFVKDADTWRRGYSRIVNAKLNGHWLILQIQTPGKKNYYSLLIYSRKDYALLADIPTNDFFLGIHKDRLYFYKDGNPGYDSETSDCTINICSFAAGSSPVVVKKK